MKDQRKALKIKIKSLAAEARFIRHEELRALGVRVKPNVFKYRNDALYHGLREHRITVVREEARCSLLAYAVIRGKPYAAIERKPLVRGKAAPFPNQWVPPDLEKVRAMVERFGGPPGVRRKCSKDEIVAWVNGEPTPTTGEKATVVAGA